jgi:hypothetical protein
MKNISLCELWGPSTVTMKSTIFWDFTPCSLVGFYWTEDFSTLKMEVVHSSESSVNIRQCRRRRPTEDSTLQFLVNEFRSPVSLVQEAVYRWHLLTWNIHVLRTLKVSFLLNWNTILRSIVSNIYFLRKQTFMFNSGIMRHPYTVPNALTWVYKLPNCYAVGYQLKCRMLRFSSITFVTRVIIPKMTLLWKLLCIISSIYGTVAKALWTYFSMAVECDSNPHSQLF